MRHLKTWLHRRMGSHHIAGPELQDAVNLCRHANTTGYSVTLALWNGPSESAGTIMAGYQQTLNEIVTRHLDARLAIKLPGLNYDKTRLGVLLEIARASGVGLQFDAHAVDTFEKTFNLVQWARARYDRVGFTLPSRWRRSLACAEQLIDLRVAVRIVKGQWKDLTTTHLDCRAYFLEIVEALAGRAVHVSVATHDQQLAHDALHRLNASRTHCELEQMIGLPLLQKTQGSPDSPVRLCIPFGNPDLPYNIRYIAERPAIAIWAVRDLLGKNHVGRENPFAASR